jgi:exopolyphosphatase/guanosine-5'-triphosphate,3'-diphosphate pyrophosphatase
VDPAPIRCACIDIGSNTTRVLVADVAAAGLREVIAQRAFTRLGRELRRTGELSAAAVGAVAEVVAGQRAAAEAAGALRLRVVATAAIRAAANGAELCAAVHERAGVAVDVLTGDEEAKLAFEGAVRSLDAPPDEPIAVVDVGGGSSEVAVGTIGGGVSWARSVAVGSGMLAEAYLRSDPPGARELRRLREHAAGAFEGLAAPPVARGVAVGGSATSMRRLVGPVIDADAAARGLAVLAGAPAASVAAAHGLEVERVRLLPAGLIVLAEASERIGRPLEVGVGGLREGVCLALAAFTS